MEDIAFPRRRICTWKYSMSVPLMMVAPSLYTLHHRKILSQLFRPRFVSSSVRILLCYRSLPRRTISSYSRDVMAPQKTKRTAQKDDSSSPKKKAKQIVSISGLFDNEEQLRSRVKSRDRDLFEARSAGVSKSHRPVENFFANYRKAKQKKTGASPLYLSFAGRSSLRESETKLMLVSETANEYKASAGFSLEQQLELVYQALIARVNGFDVQGKTLNIEGIPTEEEVAELARAEARMNKPLRDEKLTIQNTRRDGTITTTEIKLGDTVGAFHQLCQRKKVELARLYEELEKVEHDIVAVRENIDRTEATEVKKVFASFDAEMKRLRKVADDNTAHSHAEVEQAYADDREYAVKHSRMMEKMMELL